MINPYRLRDVIPRIRGPHNAILMLRAYFDESGHFRDPNESIVAIGGCLSTLEKWEIFEDEWDELLNTFRIECSHATDLKAFENEFTGWNEYRRRQFLQPALHIIDRAVNQYLGAVLPIDQWKALSPSQKTQSPNPYFLCMQDVIHAAGLETIEYGPDEMVEVFFAENLEVGGRTRNPSEIVNDPNEGRAYRCYKACKAELPIRDRLGSITFDQPKNLLPLQAADLVAFEILQIGRKMLGEKIPYEKYRWPFQQILKKGPIFHYYREGEVDNRLDWARQEF